MHEFFHNRVFKSLDALVDHLTTWQQSLADDPITVDSIQSWPWAIWRTIDFTDEEEME